METVEKPVLRVAILGAGLMGHGIAQSFLMANAVLTLWDPRPEILAGVRDRIEGHLKLLGDERSVDITLAPSIEAAVADADLVIEAAPEDLQIKRDLVAAVDAVNEDCIFASNTSVLRITEIAEGSKRPERVVGTHWWNPPYLIPLVEVVRGEKTSDETVAAVSGWLRDAAKTPVEVYKDAAGFVGNRMQFALLREAAHIVDQGICSAETVDLVAKHTFGSRLAAVGPLQNADYIGLDLISSILDYLGPSLSTTPGTPALFSDAVREGRLGAKSGKGVFDWAPGDREAVETTLIEHLVAVNGHGGRSGRAEEAFS